MGILWAAARGVCYSPPAAWGPTIAGQCGAGGWGQLARLCSGNQQRGHTFHSRQINFRRRAD